jgi:DNA-directed RNA polymerase specialized sigma24 family protein
MSDIPNESNPLGFQETMRRAIDGSQEDIQRLINEYGDCIQRVVRRRLDTRLRSKFDSLDFVQMVWASFFRDSGSLSGLVLPRSLSDSSLPWRRTK